MLGILFSGRLEINVYSDLSQILSPLLNLNEDFHFYFNCCSSFIQLTCDSAGIFSFYFFTSF